MIIVSFINTITQYVHECISRTALWNLAIAAAAKDDVCTKPSRLIASAPEKQHRIALVLEHWPSCYCLMFVANMY